MTLAIARSHRALLLALSRVSHSPLSPVCFLCSLPPLLALEPRRQGTKEQRKKTTKCPSPWPRLLVLLELVTLVTDVCHFFTHCFPIHSYCHKICSGKCCSSLFYSHRSLYKSMLVPLIAPHWSSSSLTTCIKDLWPKLSPADLEIRRRNSTSSLSLSKQAKSVMESPSGSVDTKKLPSN